MYSYCVPVRDVGGLQGATPALLLQLRPPPYGGVQRPPRAYPQSPAAPIPAPGPVFGFGGVSAASGPESLPVAVGFRAPKVFKN